MLSDLSLVRTGAIVPAEFRARVVPVLERIEAIDPENASALAIRGEIADQLGEHDEAVRLATHAAAAAPGFAWVHVILATIYGKQGDSAAMLSAIDQAVALNPLDNNVVRFRASALRQAGRIDEARAAVLRAMELDPKNSSNYWELSLNDYVHGDLVGAIVNSGKRLCDGSGRFRIAGRIGVVPRRDRRDRSGRSVVARIRAALARQHSRGQRGGVGCVRSRRHAGGDGRRARAS